MPYATHQGIRIHYELEGQGPPLVLVHGANNSLEDWRAAGVVPLHPAVLSRLRKMSEELGIAYDLE